jgi:hypothetical protein
MCATSTNKASTSSPKANARLVSVLGTPLPSVSKWLLLEPVRTFSTDLTTQKSALREIVKPCPAFCYQITVTNVVVALSSLAISDDSGLI